MRNYYIYILSNFSNKVVYIGVTNDLERRIFEHKNKLIQGFTKKYNLNKLVYFENYNRVEDALNEEKQLKGWLRKKKNILIEKENPDWEDLSEEWFN